MTQRHEVVAKIVRKALAERENDQSVAILFEFKKDDPQLGALRIANLIDTFRDPDGEKSGRIQVDDTKYDIDVQKHKDKEWIVLVPVKAKLIRAETGKDETYPFQNEPITTKSDRTFTSLAEFKARWLEGLYQKGFIKSVTLGVRNELESKTGRPLYVPGDEVQHDEQEVRSDREVEEGQDSEEV